MYGAKKKDECGCHTSAYKPINTFLFCFARGQFQHDRRMVAQSQAGDPETDAPQLRHRGYSAALEDPEGT